MPSHGRGHRFESYSTHHVIIRKMKILKRRNILKIFLLLCAVTFGEIAASNESETQVSQISLKELDAVSQWQVFWVKMAIDGLKKQSNELVILKSKDPKVILSEYQRLAQKVWNLSWTDQIYGIQMGYGRTSYKLKNPANEPRPWIKPLLKKYLSTPRTPETDAEQTFKLGANRYGVLIPLYMEASCLHCHGQNLNPKLQKELTRLYPKDQGVGFQLNEFSGFFWFETFDPKGALKTPPAK